MELLHEDSARAHLLPLIDEFLANIFASLSLSAFQSNAILASLISAPSWSYQNWSQPGNGQVFASNLALTCGGFRNAPHEDRDASNFSLGVWGLVNTKSGKLISSSERNILIQQNQQGLVCDALGAKFHIGNVVIELDQADVVFMTFNSHIPHFTSHPDILGGSIGQDVTRVATSSQISQTISKALEKISNIRGDLGEEEWLEVRDTFGRSYNDELEKKIKKL